MSKRMIKFCKLQVTTNTLFHVGKSFNFISPYIYAAAAISYWKQCLSLFTGCGFFLPLHEHFLSLKNNEK